MRFWIEILNENVKLFVIHLAVCVFFMFCLSSLLFLCVLLRFCRFSRDLCTVKDRWANSETARLVGVGVGMVAGLGSPCSCISLEMYINYGFIKIKSCTYLTGSSFTGFFFIVLLSYHDQDSHSRVPALFSIKSWCSFLTRSGLGQNARQTGEPVSLRVPEISWWQRLA